MSSRSDPSVTDDVALAAADAPPGEASIPPVSAEHAELQRQGAKAAARGEAPESNPMLDAINQPGATGESERVWSDRRDAWERGRGTQQSAAVGPIRPQDAVAAAEQPLDEAVFGVTPVLAFAGPKALVSASGFFFEREDRLFLVTSRHVLFDAPRRHAPDRIEITVHRDARDLAQWATLSLPLHRDGVALWHQARDSGGEIDVAVLELERATMPAHGVVQAFGPQHLAAGPDPFKVGDRLAIPAFPPGFFDTVHQLPVVRQASIASCHGVRFQGRACFLTDARMHPGSSGAPVLAQIEPATAGQSRWCLLGVHSSGMAMDTPGAAAGDPLGLNCAWYADVLMTLTAAARRTPP